MKFVVAPILLAVLLAGRATLDDKRPKLTVKATPASAFSPARIVVTGEVIGGANDDRDLYCAGVQWEWGDGTKSESSEDCEPYQAGKSEIKRHFIADHTYRVHDDIGISETPRDFRILLRLKRGNKVVASAGTTVRIRPGIGEPDAVSPSRWP
jgi:hypothetical protein